MRTFLISTAFMAFAADAALAESFPVIQNQTVLKECSDCHMAYPPQTLPKTAWGKIMGNLSDHFGEDASLSPAVVDEIQTYYEQNASDVSPVRAARKWRSSGAVTRITDAPRFTRKHRSCSTAVWTHDRIKSKSNCLACHPNMQKTGSTRRDISFLPWSLRLGCDDD